MGDGDGKSEGKGWGWFLEELGDRERCLGGRRRAKRRWRNLGGEK